MLTQSEFCPASEFAPRRRPAAFTHTPALRRRGLACWLAQPSEAALDAPPLVAVHGIRRGARKQAQLYAARAAALGRTVIAPVFDAESWPRYQQVVRKGRADLALLALMADLRLAGVWRTPTFALAGFSGGAQFAHRFAMLHPELVSRLTVAAAGWYTFPDAAPFPYGFGERPGQVDDWGPHLAARFDRFLRLPIQVCVGAEDCVRDPNTRSNPEIDRQQGTDRVTRARRWVASLRRSAAERDIVCRVSLNVLPGCGHDFTTCVHRGGLACLAMPHADSRDCALAVVGERPRGTSK